ncbi:MAG: hypothetical protein P8Y18_08385 [Candidatus Bathyarchaeota archaeon]|jgi:hypothetical protein
MSKLDEWEAYRKSRYTEKTNDDEDVAKKLNLIDKAFRKGKWKNLT